MMGLTSSASALIARPCLGTPTSRTLLRFQHPGGLRAYRTRILAGTARRLGTYPRSFVGSHCTKRTIRCDRRCLGSWRSQRLEVAREAHWTCLLYTSDAA